MGNENAKTSTKSSVEQASVIHKFDGAKKEQTNHSSTSNTAQSNQNSLRYSRFRAIENFIVIWLNPKIQDSNKDIQNFITHLRCIINSIKIFTDFDQCVDYLTEVKNEKVFLIVSGLLGQQIVPVICDMTQLTSIYIFCRNKSRHQRWASNYKKVEGIFTQIEVLCNELNVDVRESENSLTSISIIPSSSTTNLNELDSSFMYSHLLKEILLQDESDEREKKELVDFCRIHYADNKKEREVISEFQRNYPRPSPIWWYTRECFVYLMLNKALRTQDVEVIIKMGFIVQDLHRHIEQLHSQRKLEQLLIVVRGQGMSQSEFDKINNSKGGLLAFNNFLSTSTDQQISLNFARRARDHHDLTAVLFVINIDPNKSIAPFASLDKVSFFKDREKKFSFLCTLSIPNQSHHHQ